VPETVPPARTFRPLVHDSTSGPAFESEIRELLHRRLRVMAVVSLVAYNLFLLEYLAESFHGTITQRQWDWRNQGLLVFAIAVQLVGAAVVWLRPRQPLSRLRLVELAGFGSGALYLAGTRCVVLSAAGTGSADRATGDLYVEHAALLSNLHWIFLVAFYGLFVPNTWRRCVAVVVCLSAIPVLVTVATAYVNPLVASKLTLLVGVTCVGMFLAGSLAVFGSFKISTLQQAVFTAREEARELGQYRLTRRLGSGGMGEVYLAEHRLLKRHCAVKLIRPQLASDPDCLRRFEREVRATARLNHPNTVEIYDYGHTEDGTFYYVMEYVPGVTLDELVKRHGPVPAAYAVHLLRQLCSALRSAHGMGLVHRDIKPGNVMLCPDGTPHDRIKLLDFGLVRPVGAGDGTSKLTRDGIAVGTPEYMSPEQAEGALAIDARSDLYSTGALAHFLLAGRPPFRDATPMRVMIAHIQTPPPPLRTHRPDAPEDLEAVVLRCLAKPPAERFADATSLDRALAGCASAGQWTEERAAAWRSTAVATEALPAVGAPAPVNEEVAAPTRTDTALPKPNVGPASRRSL
jgi:serine/threonine-protein kinase